jgi:DNA-binding transcriptional ArsR family regulator
MSDATLSDVIALRPLSHAPAKRLILELAYRRHLRGTRVTFGEIHRALRMILGLQAVPNMNRHVNALVDAGVLQRDRRKGASLRLNPIPGLSVYSDWAALAPRPLLARSPAHPESMDDVEILARNARGLLDELIGRLGELSARVNER